MAEIDIRHVRKSFQNLEILKAVDLSIRTGEFIVLVGPSGCGKSTLLRMIAGLEEVTAGDIVIDGKRINDLAPRDRNLAMVFQSYALYPHMTVAGNMSYSLRLRKFAQDRIAAAIGEASRVLGLTALMERRPRALSGGQRQRVAMGRAIVREPQAFLWDEPLSNLDARLREQMRAEIKKLHRRLGTTSIYVTHDQIEAMTLADRIVAMDAGTIQQIGTPADLYDRPANLFVAGFIGSPAMNFLHARMASETPTRSALILADGPRMTVPETLGLQAGQAVIVGIRPEHIVVGDAAPRQTGVAGKTGTGAGEAIVDLVEPTGMGAIVHFRLDTVVHKAYHLGRADWKAGDHITVHFPTERLHFFGATDGRRLN
ncbi:sn-glycerol-3-phosphate ABC transporter ATP-binding protein UgpC [Jiella sp. MQZ9-1]|uniref:Sn-glycerol-3-phosphate ABC transporter ATP-binding protein UgpC n=1 Tax=Jiella flava TaxID=2816857 RepID=A0A939G263_9HYPH|nr:sn-glycerol-3-phosphate ABC transporter ATP-binding protein UgpC [Jiella flava]MBO0663827.1 sn-glycerol-3-phosphate ABC transporter ATP-binding protein UgpC [Jiella flava]MCD2472400.1 sn-glycerol-3-phosphate ABC transporter ATP-binding protein UgpC [Jiella flava]